MSTVEYVLPSQVDSKVCVDLLKLIPYLGYTKHSWDDSPEDPTFEVVIFHLNQFLQE